MFKRELPGHDSTLPLAQAAEWDRMIQHDVRSQ